MEKIGKKNVLKYSALLFALAVSCSCANAATEISTWDEFNTAGDILLKQDITADNTRIEMSIISDTVIDGGNHTLNGNSNSNGFLDIAGKLHPDTKKPEYNLTVQNFGKLSVGSSSAHDFSYTDVAGKTIYNNIDSSIKGFANSALQVKSIKNLIVDNSVFYNNNSLTSHGGAIYLSGELPSIKILNSTFVNNQVSRSGFAGGAINLSTGVQIDEIKNSVFVGNESASDGGAINSSGHIAKIDNSVFENNTANNKNGSEGNEGGGAVSLNFDAGSDTFLTTIKNSRFTGNTSKSHGGAIVGYGLSNKTVLDIDNSKFVNNTSLRYGGAIKTNTNLNLSNSSFVKNESGTEAGALYLALASSKSDTDKVLATISNTTFSENISKNGGGGAILVVGTDDLHELVIKDSTFTENESRQFGEGGAIKAHGKLTVLNSTFSNNSTNYLGGAIALVATSDAHSLTLVDTSFTGNSALYDAGAIFADSDVNIFAVDKNVLFNNNSTTYSGLVDLYIQFPDNYQSQKDRLAVNLSAAENKNITFNGVVWTWNNYTGLVDLNINKSGSEYTAIDGTTKSFTGAGEVVFNDRVDYMDVNLHAGTLTIGKDNLLDNSNIYIKGNSILNTINNSVGDIHSVKSITDDDGNSHSLVFKVAKDVTWQYQFDVDLANEKSDKLLVTENLGNLSLSKLNIFSDMTETQYRVKVTFSDTNLNASLAEGYTITTSQNSYDFSVLNDEKGSHLVIDKTVDGAGLAHAVAKESDQYVVTIDQNEVVDSWISGKNNVSKDMEIQGHNQNITTTAGVEGMVVDSNIKFTVNNVNEMTGFTNALTANSGSTIELNNTSFSNNSGDAVLTNNNGVINIIAETKDINIHNGAANNAILSDGGTVNLLGSKNINLTGNVIGSNNAQMNISTNANLSDTIDGMIVTQNLGNTNVNSITNGKYILNESTLNLNGALSNSDFTLNNGNVNILSEFDAKLLTLNGGSVSSVNNAISEMSAKDLLINPSTVTNFSLDVDLANESMDKLTADNVGMFSKMKAETAVTTPQIHIDRFNYISDTTEQRLSINFTESETLKGLVSTSVNSYVNKIYNYDVSYDKMTGNFNFVGGGSDSSGYNPSVLASPIAAQLGGYLTQLNSYDEAFRNMDMYMLMTKEQRQALKLKNKYASSVTSGITYSNPKLAQYSNPAGWFRPYATFENVRLDNGPRVSNVAYGSYFGGESEIYDLGNGWDGILGVYVGYNGSHQSYNGVGMYQNGGTLGLVGMAYKDNFFTGLTVNAGANVGEANTMFGKEDFTMLMSGIANKTGYNWELAEGKLIIQPSIMASYTFVNTFDYTNAAGVSINSDPLHAIHLEPGLKIIGNLQNGWQPYGSVSMVWNIMDNTEFTANTVSLPNLSVEPYVKYGVGVRKSWGERLTGYFQTYFTNGGRNGVGLQAGFRWRIGKDKPAKATNTEVPKLAKTEIKVGAGR